MDKLLLTVEERFQLTGRGLAVLPFTSPEILGTPKSGHRQQVRLVRPDGEEEITEVTFYWEHFNPGGFRLCLYLECGKEEQVPIGTQVWLVDRNE